MLFTPIKLLLAASSNSGAMTGVFWIFLICLYVISIKQIKKDAYNDMPL